MSQFFDQTDRGRTRRGPRMETAERRKKAERKGRTRGKKPDDAFLDTGRLSFSLSLSLSFSLASLLVGINGRFERARARASRTELSCRDRTLTSEEVTMLEISGARETGRREEWKKPSRTEKEREREREREREERTGKSEREAVRQKREG